MPNANAVKDVTIHVTIEGPKLDDNFKSSFTKKIHDSLSDLISGMVNKNSTENGSPTEVSINTNGCCKCGGNMKLPSTNDGIVYFNELIQSLNNAALPTENRVFAVENDISKMIEFKRMFVFNFKTEEELDRVSGLFKNVGKKAQDIANHFTNSKNNYPNHGLDAIGVLKALVGVENDKCIIPLTFSVDNAGVVLTKEGLNIGVNKHEKEQTKNNLFVSPLISESDTMRNVVSETYLRLLFNNKVSSTDYVVVLSM